jgi:hypothetical protein
VTTNATSLSFSADGAGEISYALSLSERTVTVDPVVEVNGNSTSHSGTLAPGETASLPADADWIQTGTNTVTIDFGSGAEEVTPGPLVDLQYTHDYQSTTSSPTPTPTPTSPSTELPTNESTETDSEAPENSDGSDSDENEAPSSGGGGGGGGGGGSVADVSGDGDEDESETPTASATPVVTAVENSSSVVTSESNNSSMAVQSGDDTVVTNVSFEPSRVSTNVQANVVVTVQNPQSTTDTHTVDLEISGQVVSSRQVTVPAGGEATVRFNFNFVEPGTYTARVDSETATVTVVEPGELTSTPDATSTQFPGFGPIVVLVSAALAVVLFTRRD